MYANRVNQCKSSSGDLTLASGSIQSERLLPDAGVRAPLELCAGGPRRQEILQSPKCSDQSSSRQ